MLEPTYPVHVCLAGDGGDEAPEHVEAGGEVEGASEDTGGLLEAQHAQERPLAVELRNPGLS